MIPIPIAPEMYIEEQEFDDMGSVRHSLVQANLAHLLKLTQKFTVFIELSLDANGQDLSAFNVKDELVPDVCGYPNDMLIPRYDILRMTEMPILAIEVQSPRQGMLVLVQKVGAYFALGVQSCWIVDPQTQSVHVFSDPLNSKAFDFSETITDRIADVSIQVSEIFA